MELINKPKIKENWKKIFTNWKAFFLSFLWLIVIIFALDIATKWIVQTNVGFGEKITVIPGFIGITLNYNLGAAFGLGSGGELGWRIAWILISLILSAALSFYYVIKMHEMDKAVRVGFALMISGAVGNLIDRAFYWNNIVGFDGVVDWIEFLFFKFPIFNLADSSLVIGVCIFIVVLIVEAIKEAMKKNKAGEYSLSPKELEKKQEDNKASEEKSEGEKHE